MVATYHVKLIDIILWMDKERYPLIYTSAYRPGDPGVHGTIPGRGLDIRSHVFPDPQAVADRINVRWEYDPHRPEKLVAIYHKKRRGWHLHIQAHDLTRDRIKAVAVKLAQD